MLIIEAGNLLQDTSDNKIIAQLKLKNVSNKIIKEVHIKLFPLDAMGQTIGSSFDFSYNALNIPRDEEFGQQTPIYFSISGINSFSAVPSRILYMDGTEWNNTGSLCGQIPSKKKLDDVFNPEISDEFKRQYGSQSEYVPFDYKDLWVCSCGNVNSIDELNCHHCHRDKINKAGSFDAEAFENRYNQAKEEKRQKEKQEKEKRNEEIKNQIKSHKLLIGLCVILAALGIIFYFNYWHLSSDQITEVNNSMQLIDAISAPGNNSDYYSSVDIAEQSYEELSIKERRHVSNSQKLIDATAKRDSYKIQDVEEAIDAIGNPEDATEDNEDSINEAENKYQSLSKELQNKVKNSNAIEIAKSSVSSHRINKVISEIDSLGTISEDSGEKLKEIIAVYNKLPDEEKGKVTNYETLQSKNNQYNQLKADSVIQMINDIGEINLKSRRKVVNAKKAYDELNLDQQTLVTNAKDLDLSVNQLDELIRNKPRVYKESLSRNGQENYIVYTYKYDDEYNLIQVHYSSSDHQTDTYYTYNEYGERLTESTGIKDIAKYEYDSSGRLTREIQYGGNAAVTIGGNKGQTGDETIRYSYDNQGNVIEEKHSYDGGYSYNVQYEYDSSNHKIRMSSKDGDYVETYSYDERGNMIKETDTRKRDGSSPMDIFAIYEQGGDFNGNTTLPDAVTTTTYTYDDHNNVTSRHTKDNEGYSSSETYVNEYDAEGRLASVTNTDTNDFTTITTYSYEE